MGPLISRRRVCGIRFRVCMSCLKGRGLRGLFGIVVSAFNLFMGSLFFLLFLPWGEALFFFLPTLLKSIQSTAIYSKVLSLSFFFPPPPPPPPQPARQENTPPTPSETTIGNKNSTSNGRTFIHNKDKTTGSSRGRGTRAAGWFDDYIQKQKNPHMKSLTLAEGIKGWSGAGKEYTDLMDGYEERVWREGKGEK